MFDREEREQDLLQHAKRHDSTQGSKTCCTAPTLLPRYVKDPSPTIVRESVYARVTP